MPPESSTGDLEDLLAAGASAANEQGDNSAAGSPPTDTPDAKTADSSNADDPDAKKELSTLDVVKAALAEERSGESSSSETGSDTSESDGSDEPAAEAEARTEQADEEPPPFHQHPRWKAVQAELKELRPLKDEIETARPKAEAFDQLHGYMTEANLATEEVNEGFSIMRLLKNDPASAIAPLEAYLNAARQAAGLVLPPDLQERVNRGYLTESDALEITKSKSREAMAARAAEDARHNADQRMAESSRTAIVNAIEKWDTQWKQSDPDHELLVPLVKDRIAVLLKDKVPKTVQEALDIAEQAKTEVSASLKKLRPKTKPIDPPATGGAAATKPAPATSLDVVKMAVGQS